MADNDSADRDKPPGTPDPDRSAILKRRQQFIAAAIVGLATASVGCDACQPSVCLKKTVGPPNRGAKQSLGNRRSKGATKNLKAKAHEAKSKKAKQKAKGKKAGGP